MSEIESTWDNRDMICPYCGYGYQSETEGITEDEYEVECEKCGKKFWGTHSIVVYNEGIPDCELNGEKHIWRKDTKHKYAYCGVCGKNNPVLRMG